MNSSRREPSDVEIDRLLAGRYRETSSAFEQRWQTLQRELRQETAKPRGRRPGWPVWWGGALAALAGVTVVVLLVWRPATAPGPAPMPDVSELPEFSPTFVEMLELNDLLDEASPLLDAENRDALQHLPVQPTSHT